MVSAADARNFHWRTGSRIGVLERLAPGLPTLEPGTIGLRVVGTYAQVDRSWWDGTELTGRSGRPADPHSLSLLHDDLLTARSSIIGKKRVQWADARYDLDHRLARGGMGADEVLRLSREIRSFVKDPGSSYSLTASSSLPGAADKVLVARDQARVTVPLLAAQLGLVGLVVLWLVLAAAAEQRRQDLAVVRLRGRSTDQARTFLVRELLPVVLLGWPVGVAASVLLARLVARWVLPVPVPFEITGVFWVVTALVALVLCGVTLAVAHRTSRIPLIDLLRRTPARRTRWAMGAAEAVVVAVSAAFAVAALTGGVRGPVGLVLPSLLALGVGLTCAHLVGPVANRLGQWLLTRGRFRAGVGILHAGRRPATRQLVAIVTVGVALLTFSVDAVAVAARNRALAAEQQLGAPMRATVAGRDLVGLRRALSAVDPQGRSATPIVVAGGGGGTETTLGVVPDAFSRIGYTGNVAGLRSALAELSPPTADPILIRGTRLRSTARWRDPAGMAQPPFRVALELLPSGGDLTTVDLGEIGLQRPARVEAVLPCAAGCVVTGITVGLEYDYQATGRVSTGILVLGPALVDGSPVRLGRPRDWRVKRDDPAGNLVVSRSTRSRTVVEMSNYGVPRLAIRHRWLPADLQVVQNPEVSGEGVRVVLALDGESWQTDRVAAVRRIPGAGPGTSLVDLRTLTRAGERPGRDVGLGVLFGSSSSRLEKEVRTALRAEGLTLTDVQRTDDVRDQLAASVPAWSLLLGVLIGVVGLLMCSVALVVVATTTSRSRSRDLAALSLAGAPRPAVARVALIEQLPALALAVPLGCACGVLGAAISLGRVPLFAETPEVSTIDLSTAWGWVLGATAVAAVVLVLVAAWCGHRVARGADLERVREAL